MGAPHSVERTKEIVAIKNFDFDKNCDIPLSCI